MKKIIVITAICAICTQGQSQSWNLTGNAGTTSTTNFVGTTDNKALKFRTNNANRMTITSNGKIGIGTTTPVSKLDVKGGSINTDVDYRIGGITVLSVKGSQNIFLGEFSGHSNSTGYNNIANGYNALYSNTNGYNNIAIGPEALYFNSAGYSNIAIGLEALYFNSTGTDNVAVGQFALQGNTIGTQNTGIGKYALWNCAIGSLNTAVGWGSQWFCGSGIYNTSVGALSLSSNVSGNYNTAIGENAMFTNVNSFNTCVGFDALYGTVNSQYNTAIGFYAGDSHDNGYNNVFLGANTDVTGTGYYNVVAVGQGTIVGGASTARFGNAATGSYGGWANWTNVSDGRFKKNIKENVPGIEFISKLRPVTYTLAATELDEFLHKNAPLNMSEEGKKVYDKALKEKELVTYTGFIAQEVELSAKDLGYDFSGVDKPKNDNDTYGLRYAEFVVPLVKAVQELDKANAELKMQNAELKMQNAELKSRIEKLESVVSDKASQTNLLNNSSTLLLQNTPNPFSEKTIIKFNIPVAAQQAEIKIYNAEGKELNAYPVSSIGTGQIEISGNTLSAGTYTYTLIVDGKTADSKQMILTK